MPSHFADRKFINKLGLAIHRTKGAVNHDLEQFGVNTTLGLAIYPDGKGGYDFGESPNSLPNEGVPQGIKGVAGTGKEAITGASALVIAQPEFVRNGYILNNTQRWQNLSVDSSAPVVVTSVRADIFVFNGNNDPVTYTFPRN